MSHVLVMCFTSQVSRDWITKEIVCDFICQILAYAVVIHLISHENYHAFVSILLNVALRSEWPHAVVDFYMKFRRVRLENSLRIRVSQFVFR